MNCQECGYTWRNVLNFKSNLAAETTQTILIHCAYNGTSYDIFFCFQCTFVFDKISAVKCPHVLHQTKCLETYSFWTKHIYAIVIMFTSKQCTNQYYKSITNLPLNARPSYEMSRYGGVWWKILHVVMFWSRQAVGPIHVKMHGSESRIKTRYCTFKYLQRQLLVCLRDQDSTS